MKPTFLTMVLKAIQDGASAYLWGLISPHSASSLVLYLCQKFAPFPTHSEIRHHSHILCSFPSTPLTTVDPPAWNTYTHRYIVILLTTAHPSSLSSNITTHWGRSCCSHHRLWSSYITGVSVPYCICLTGCCHHFPLRPMRQGIRFVLIHTVSPPPRTMHILGIPWWSSG